jgi:hypothetical protein
MAILKEEIIGNKIHNVIESSNIRKTVYDVMEKKLLVEFNNGLQYEYYDFPHQIYTQFRNAPSQGKFFLTNIAKNYKYKKI